MASMSEYAVVNMDVPTSCSKCSLLCTDYDVTEYFCAGNSYLKWVDVIDVPDYYRMNGCPIVGKLEKLKSGEVRATIFDD